MKQDTSQLLELDVILENVAALTVSPPGRERVASLFAMTDVALLQMELNRVTELRSIIDYDDPFPLSPFEDLRPVLRRAEVLGAFLQPDAFMHLHRFLITSRKVKQYFDERPEKYPLLRKAAGSLTSLVALEKAIGHVIDTDGGVKDRASDGLSRIRRDIQRKVHRVRDRLETLLKSMIAKGYAQEESLAFREGRPVIPMKESHHGRLKGIVIDQSSSGATLYIEPLDVLEANNEIRRLRVQERQEIERILRELTDRIREHLTLDTYGPTQGIKLRQPG